MVRALLLLWLLEINIVCSLALFIVQAGTCLSTVLRLAVRVLQTPVSELKVAPFSVLTLAIIHLMFIMVMVVIWVLEVRCSAVMR